MTPRLDCARIRSQRETHPGFHWLTLELPGDYPEPLPGQYLNLRVGPLEEFTFRRPFGVVEFHRETHAATIELYYAVVGRGTAAMARWREGDAVDCLGPLGAAYTPDLERPALLIAGGRGAAPLLYLNRLLKERGHRDARFAFGVREKSLLFGLERLDRDRLLVASDDGSVGHHGTVIAALEARPEWFAGNPVIYACGPEALLAATAHFAARHRLRAQVGLEGIYGCGLGLCRGCAVPLKDEPRYLMQCVEGPVLDAARVDWGRMHV